MWVQTLERFIYLVGGIRYLIYLALLPGYISNSCIDPNGEIRALFERMRGHGAGARSEPLSPLGAGGRRRPPTPEPLAVPVWKTEEAAARGGGERGRARTADRG